MRTIELVELDRRAVDVTVRLVDRIGADDVLRSTPCEGWTVSDLLAHMAIQQYGIADAADGMDTDLARWRPVLLTDPAREYRAACDRVLAAFAVPDIGDRHFLLPEIVAHYPFPAAQAISFHLVDNVVHGWDVAASLGLPVEFDADVLDAALAVAEAVPNGPNREQEGAAFAPGLTVDDGADALSRILLLLGRSPNWPNR